MAKQEESDSLQGLTYRKLAGETPGKLPASPGAWFPTEANPHSPAYTAAVEAVVPIVQQHLNMVSASVDTEQQVIFHAHVARDLSERIVSEVERVAILLPQGTPYRIDFESEEPDES